MTAPTEVKVRLEPALKKNFEKKCREAGTTMSSAINNLILEAIEEIEEAAAPDKVTLPEPQPEIEPEEVNPLEDVLTEQIEELARLGRFIEAIHPQKWLSQWFDRQVTPEFSHLAREQAELYATSNMSFSAIQNRLEIIEWQTKSVKPRFYEDHKIWAAFISGGLALVLILALLPGESPPSRFLARKLVGGNNDVHAAAIMAGGNSFSGGLVAETSALMKNEQFAHDFARCVAKAKYAKSETRCKLKFPILVRD